MRFPLAPVVLALGAVVALSGCSEPTWGTAPSGDATPGVIYSRQDRLQGLIGDTLDLDVAMAPASLRTSPSVQWISRQPEVVQVLGPGRVVLRERGATQVVITAGAVRDSVLVTSDTTLGFDLGAVTSCEAVPLTRAVRLADVGRVRLLADVGNPRSDLSPSAYRYLAQLLDTLVLPVAERTFGPLLDLDGNRKLLVLLTKTVNAAYRPEAQTFPGGYVATRDLFPRRRVERLLGCGGSNHGEVFYLFTPDPDGVWSPPRPGVTLQRFLPALAVHELQHLINGEQRLHRAFAPQLESVWLNEGLSHLAEDVLYRHVTAQRPGEFRDLATLRRLGPVDTLVHPFWQYLRQNLIRATLVQESPAGPGPFGPDGQTTRGATWMWLRFLDDQGLRRRPWTEAAFSSSPGLGTVRHLLGAGAPELDVLLHRFHLGLALDALQWPTTQRDLTQRSWSYATLSDTLFPTRPIQRWRWAPGQTWSGTVAAGSSQWVVLTGRDTLRFTPAAARAASSRGCLLGPVTTGASVSILASADSLSALAICVTGPVVAVVTPTTLATEPALPLSLTWGRPAPSLIASQVLPALPAVGPDAEMQRREAEYHLLAPRILGAASLGTGSAAGPLWRVTLIRGPQ